MRTALALVWIVGTLGAAWAGEVRAVCERGRLVLANDRARLELDAETFTLQSLRDVAQGVEYVREPGGGLFTLVAREPGTAPPEWFRPPSGRVVPAGAFSARTAALRNEPGRATLELSFRDAPLDDAVVHVAVTIALDAGDSLFAWRARVDNRSSADLQQLHFPELSGLASDRPGSETADFMAVPWYSGLKVDAPRTKYAAPAGLCDYPGSGMSVQFASYSDGMGGTLYMGAHDAGNYAKSLIAGHTAAKAAFQWRFVHYFERPMARDVWDAPYTWYAGPLEGDWYDAAKRYRAWTEGQPRWRPLRERHDIPDWFRTLGVWFQGNEWRPTPEALAEFTDELILLREQLGEDIGFHWYIWQKYRFHDYNYPDYLPARPGFADAVRRAQAAGVHAMPYINIHQMETTLPLVARDGADRFWKLDGAGKPYPFGVHGKEADRVKNMNPMCPATTYWRDLIVNIARELLDTCGPDAVYYDETYCFPALCFARNHDHAWIGGPGHADGIADIHRRTRRGGVVTTGEGLGESYIDVCDGLLDAFADARPDSLPMFQTVHADRTTEIGLHVTRDEIGRADSYPAKLGFAFVRGRQLGWFNSDQFRMMRPEFAPQREILKRFLAARREGLEFLFEGEMLRAPDTSALPRTPVRWFRPDRGQWLDIEFPAVLAECYRGRGGAVGLALANPTEQEREVAIPWNARDWGLAPGDPATIRVFVGGAWTEPVEGPLPEAITVIVPPLAPALVSIRP